MGGTGTNGGAAWIVVSFEALVHDHQGYSGESSEPVPGAVRALKALRAKGYRIAVESSRVKFAVEAYLVQHQIPFDEIVASPEQKALFTVIDGIHAKAVSGEWRDVVEALQQ